MVAAAWIATEGSMRKGDETCNDVFYAGSFHGICWHSA